MSTILLGVVFVIGTCIPEWELKSGALVIGGTNLIKFVLPDRRREKEKEKKQMKLRTKHQTELIKTWYVSI